MLVCLLNFEQLFLKSSRGRKYLAKVQSRKNNLSFFFFCYLVFISFRKKYFQKKKKMPLYKKIKRIIKRFPDRFRCQNGLKYRIPCNWHGLHRLSSTKWLAWKLPKRRILSRYRWKATKNCASANVAWVLFYHLLAHTHTHICTYFG